jgi:hypothetical protein
MTYARATRRRCLVLMAIGTSAALVATGCRRPPRRPTPTTTTTTTTSATTTTVAGHDHGGTDDDKGWSLLTNGHQHAHGEVPIDEATQRELSRQLDLTRQLIARYPTVAEAQAAGYRRAGPFAPGLGSHYVGFSASTGVSGGGAAATGPMTDEQILHPILVFNGWTPDAPLIGFMYMAMGLKAEPEGFAGPNDHWHYHTNVCITMGADGIDVPLGADKDLTQAQCAAVGGYLLPVTGYMAHVWTVPGWENPDGVFAELNPKITCRDGTYHTVPMEQIGTNKTECLDEAVIN